MNRPEQNGPLRVLIVENHPDTLEAMKLYFEDGGYEVFTSMTVKGATAIFAWANCQIVICDIGLPDGTGWEVLEKIKASGRHPFAVAMSGFGINANNARSREAGFRYHLLKPFKSAELDKILAEASAEMC